MSQRTTNQFKSRPARNRTYESWADYCNRIDRYRILDREGRDSYLFRGQANNAWSLQPTIDRLKNFTDAESREKYQLKLLTEFSAEGAGVREGSRIPEDPEHAEEIARHHGLPTRLLDWSASPYIAAFFAFYDVCEIPDTLRPDYVSVWYIRQSKITAEMTSSIEIFNARYSDNVRAIAQRSAFTRLRSNDRSVDSVLRNAVFRLDIPSSDAEEALSHLDEMNINPTSLYHNLEGAAKSVFLRNFILE